MWLSWLRNVCDGFFLMLIVWLFCMFEWLCIGYRLVLGWLMLLCISIRLVSICIVVIECLCCVMFIFYVVIMCLLCV